MTNMPSKRKRYDARSRKIVAMVLTIVLLFIATYAIAEAGTTFGLSRDFSAEQLYSLSDASKHALAGLDTDIYIYTLFTTDTRDEYIEQLLEEYRKESSHIHVENIDPVMNPGFIREFDETKTGVTSGSLIVTNADKSLHKLIYTEDLYLVDASGNPLGTVAEQRITSALHKITSGIEKRALILQGHNEMAVTQTANFLNLLDTLNYDIAFHTLAAPELDGNTVLNPETDVLIAVNPVKDLTEEEAAALRAFLEEGGTTMLFMGNVIYASTGTTTLLSQPLANFESIMAEYGMSVTKNYLVNEGAQSTVADRPTVLLMHDTETGYDIVAGEVSGMEAQGASVLLKTGEAVYAKPITAAFTTLEESQGDARGPFITAAISEESNVCVLSFSSIVSDLYIGYQDNRAFLTFCLNALSGDNMSVDVQPRYLNGSVLHISSAGQLGVLVILVLIILPLTFLAFGIITYRKRRKL